MKSLPILREPADQAKMDASGELGRNKGPCRQRTRTRSGIDGRTAGYIVHGRLPGCVKGGFDRGEAKLAWTGIEHQ